MARLVVHPGSPSSWEIRLKPGSNSIGRNITNHFQINDPSVSGAHCQIVISDGGTRIVDLGSTNGTFVNREAVRETDLAHGCELRLGNVQLQFFLDEAAPPLAAPPSVIAASSSSGVGISALADIVLPTGKVRPSQVCKFHPGMAARYSCPKCRHYFCDTCVATRGGTHDKFCRRCGVECAPVQVQYEEIVERTFFERLPGAFAYPVRGAGVIVLIVGIVLLGLLKAGQALFRFGTIRTIIFGVILEILAGGYLFSYLQAIIHSTSAEENELPDLPGISNPVDDILAPFFKLLILILFCFGPATAAGVWMMKAYEKGPVAAFIACTAFGYFYYPMAFLSVAIHDSITAANPLLVIPSILKVPVKYLISLLFLAASAGVQWFGALAAAKFFPEGWTTHEMGLFAAMIGSMVLLSFLSFYLLVVGLHLLSLIFVTSKTELGWLKS